MNLIEEYNMHLTHTEYGMLINFGADIIFEVSRRHPIIVRIATINSSNCGN